MVRKSEKQSFSFGVYLLICNFATQKDCGMKYGIIAAGAGSRLMTEGVRTPKPLVEVNGETLIDRLVRVFMDNDAEEIVVVCNETNMLVPSHLVGLQRDGLRGRHIPLRFMMKTTRSSMHSFAALADWLKGGPFVLTTVDTVFREDEFSAFVSAFKQAVEGEGCDGLMGVTDYIDDERPLYVKVGEEMEVKAFVDSDDEPRYVSAGIYGLTPRSLVTLGACMECGVERMRNFQRALLADGLRLRAFPFVNVVDIDHVGDIRKAEALATPL